MKASKFILFSFFIIIPFSRTQLPESQSESASCEKVPEKKLSAKEKRRLREKERQENAARRKQEEKLNEVPLCKICNEEFETRNQLFKHIKQVILFQYDIDLYIYKIFYESCRLYHLTISNEAGSPNFWQFVSCFSE